MVSQASISKQSSPAEKVIKQEKVSQPFCSLTNSTTKRRTKVDRENSRSPKEHPIFIDSSSLKITEWMRKDVCATQQTSINVEDRQEFSLNMIDYPVS